MKKAELGITVLLLALLGSAVQAQSFAIDWWTTDGGGSTSTGGVFTVSGTIGQPDAGTMRGGQFTVEGGFSGIVAAIQTEGAPTLSIELTSGWVKVSWPTPAPGWCLPRPTGLRHRQSAVAPGVRGSIPDQ